MGSVTGKGIIIPVGSCNCCPGQVSKTKQFEKESHLENKAREKVIGREIVIKNKSKYDIFVRVSSCKITNVSNKIDESFQRENSYSASIGNVVPYHGNISVSNSNNNSKRDLIESSISFSQNNIINEEFISIQMYSQRKYDGGYDKCYISAYHYLEDDHKNDTNQTKIWIAKNWNVSAKDNIFVFDGNTINTEINKNIISCGKYYIITVFDQDKSLSTKGNKLSVPIQIYSLRHTKYEQFNLDICQQHKNYCNVQNIANGLFWQISHDLNENKLIQSKDNQQINQQFQFEQIAHSTTYRIKSRQNGLYLAVDGNVLSMKKWNDKDLKQRFILEPHN